MTGSERLRLGLPQGTLQETTRKLFKRAGYTLALSERSYYPDIDDEEIECVLVRAQEVARYVEQGVMDCGITGCDWVLENQSDVEELADLEAPWSNYRTIRWVLAVKESSPFESVADLEGKRIATEAVGLTKHYLAGKGVTARVEFSWGATEVKPPTLADAIVDVSETGLSLRANQLRVIDVVFESTPRFIANKQARRDPWKREKMDRLLLLLRAAIAAAGQVGLGMNVPRERLDRVLALLPALDTPTISTLADEKWVDVFTVVAEKEVRELIPQLAEVGARGIIEYPLNKIVA